MQLVKHGDDDKESELSSLAWRLISQSMNPIYIRRRWYIWSVDGVISTRTTSAIASNDVGEQRRAEWLNVFEMFGHFQVHSPRCVLCVCVCVCVSRSATFIDLHKNNFIHCSSWWSYWRFRATFTYLLIHLPANCGQVKTEILRVPFAKLLIRAEFGPFFQSGESQRAIYAYHIPHTASRIS